jgi:hypothetical protein
MLKNRSLIILAAILVVLAVISFMQRSSHRDATSHSDTSPVLSGGFDQDKLQKIEVGYGPQKEAVVLERLPDGWVVRTAYSHPASQQRIDNLLTNLQDLGGEFRSDAADVLPDYGFTDSTTVTITGYGAEATAPLFSLEIGKKPQGSVGNFVKLPGNSAVYLTRKGILSSLGIYGEPETPKSKHFLELTAQQLERLDVDAITIHDGDSVIAMDKEFAMIEPEPVKTDTAGVDTTAAGIAAADSLAAQPQIDRNTYEWRITAPVNKLAMKTKGDQVLSGVATVRAVDIDDPGVDPAEYGLDNPQRWVEIKLQDGSTVTLQFGNERPESEGQQAGIYLRIGGKDSVWVVSKYQMDNIFKKLEDLLPEKE